ncbi:MAG: prepilin-type N-terminal cleavage/methylation domain-containing protein [Pseudomonadota bacterium]
MSNRRGTLQRSSRGFTLVELLGVVVITGVLSVLAVAGFRRHMQSARGTEAVAVIQAIRSAQESYMAENHVYLNVSTSSGGLSWYPQLTQSKKRSTFVADGHPDFARWQQLAPSVKETVMFGYLVNAGVPGTVIPSLQVTAAPVFIAAQPLDWYVIQARGDVNEDGVVLALRQHEHDRRSLYRERGRVSQSRPTPRFMLIVSRGRARLVRHRPGRAWPTGNASSES